MAVSLYSGRQTDPRPPPAPHLRSHHKDCVHLVPMNLLGIVWSGIRPPLLTPPSTGYCENPSTMFGHHCHAGTGRPVNSERLCHAPLPSFLPPILLPDPVHTLTQTPTDRVCLMIRVHHSSQSSCKKKTSYGRKKKIAIVKIRNVYLFIWHWFTFIPQLKSKVFLSCHHLKRKPDRKKVTIDKIRNVYQSLFGSSLLLHLSSILKFFLLYEDQLKWCFQTQQTCRNASLAFFTDILDVHEVFIPVIIRRSVFTH